MDHPQILSSEGRTNMAIEEERDFVAQKLIEISSAIKSLQAHFKSCEHLRDSPKLLLDRGPLSSEGSIKSRGLSKRREIPRRLHARNHTPYQKSAHQTRSLIPKQDPLRPSHVSNEGLCQRGAPSTSSCPYIHTDATTRTLIPDDGSAPQRGARV